MEIAILVFAVLAVLLCAGILTTLLISHFSVSKKIEAAKPQGLATQAELVDLERNLSDIIKPQHLVDITKPLALQQQLIDFEKRAAEANKTLADFLIKVAEQGQALNKRIVDVDKRLGDELLANAEDLSELKTIVLKVLQNRNLVEVDRGLDDYTRYQR